MKASLTNVVIGAVVVLTAIYLLKPAGTYEGFEGPSAGSVLGMVFAGILGLGILLAFFGGMGESIKS